MESESQKSEVGDQNSRGNGRWGRGQCYGRWNMDDGRWMMEYGRWGRGRIAESG